MYIFACASSKIVVSRYFEACEASVECLGLFRIGRLKRSLHGIQPVGGMVLHGRIVIDVLEVEVAVLKLKGFDLDAV